MKIRRALKAFDSCPPEQQGPTAAIHLLSSFNLEPIEPALQLGLRCIPCRPNLSIAPLDTIEQEILNPNSAIYQSGGLATVLIWRAEELLPGLFFPCSTSLKGGDANSAEEVIGRIKNLIRAFLANGSGTLFVSTLMPPPATGGVLLDSQTAVGLAAAIARVNLSIHGMAGGDSRVKILDVHQWAAAEGAALHDMQMDFMARQPFTIRAALSFSQFLARNIRPMLVPRRKVLAVDLDNTLWGGILGEDGLANLKLGRDFPGSIFLRIQREILELKNQGVLLVLASKNEESDARKAMESLPDMALRWEDFVSHKVNFNPKYLNLREAASELGLGIDSFTFLDDSDFEREQMQQFNPEVGIINSRSETLHMLENILHTDAFDTHHIGEEDRKRHHEYELRSARSAKPQENIEDFLRSLELHAKVETVSSGNQERVFQMLGKTNQFNVTTRRHSLEDVGRMAAIEGSVCLTLRLKDKFGDQGIVGVMLAIPDSTESGTLEVDSFLISCRALGRGVEEVLWAELTPRGSEKKFTRLKAEYIPTAKNGVVAGIFDRLGMTCTEDGTAGKKYLLEQLRAVTSPRWITVEY